MSTRKIIDAKIDNEKVYLKGHAKATYMSDGRTVEDAINSVISGSNVDLSDFVTKVELNGKVDKVEGKQLSTEDFTTILKQKLEGLSNYDDTSIEQAVQSLQTLLNTLVSGNVSAAVESFNEIIAFFEGVEDTQSLSSIIAGIEGQIAGKQATISDLEAIRSGAAKGATALQEEQYKGTYSKPSGGIPKSDLADAVQTSLGKADSALQSFTETDPIFKASAASGITDSDISNWNSKTSNTGTITGITMNGTSKGSSGVVDLGTVITSHQDISGKQDKLVSGTNIKSINGTSLLGDGDIKINAQSEIPIVEHGSGVTSFALTPNVFHKWGTVSSLSLTLATPSDPTILSEYVFQFTSGSTATSLTLPSTVKWASELSIEPNKTYLVSIIDNLGVIGGF